MKIQDMILEGWRNGTLVEQISLNLRDLCPRCEYPSLASDLETGEMICSFCGAVFFED